MGASPKALTVYLGDMGAFWAAGKVSDGHKPEETLHPPASVNTGWRKWTRKTKLGKGILLL